MLTFLRPTCSVASLIYAARTAKATAAIPRCVANGTRPPASRLRLIQRTKMADRKAYLIGHRAEHKQHVESRIGRSRGYRGQQYECTGRNEIFQSQRSQMRLALYQGVDHIERFGQGREAKKPAAAGEKVILIALIFIEILRKKQGTQEIVHRCVHANEEIEAIGPVLDLVQPKLPPPERNHVQERPGDPAQVYRPDPVATGVLDQCRDAADQTRDAEPEDQGDQYAHVKIEIEIGRQGRTLSHQSQFSLTIEAAQCLVAATAARRMIPDDGSRVARSPSGQMS